MPSADGESYGASISGGSEDATFYLSAETTHEDGVYTKDNVLRRVNLQANATGNVGSRLSVRANVGLVESDLQYDPCPMITEGMTVEVTHGPLKGVVGKLVRKGAHARLVLSVDLIGQAVSNGCVRVRNDLLQRLFDRTLAGTPVTVRG